MEPKPKLSTYLTRISPFLFRIPVDLVPVIYCSVVTQGNGTEWNYLWKKFESENVAAEQVTILGALGCTKNEDLIKVRRAHSVGLLYGEI